MKVEGVWLPIITPFRDDKVDFASYFKLMDHYIAKGISGLVPLGTTGESPTISEAEFEEIVDKTVTHNAGRVPILIGVGGNYTKKVIKTLKMVEKYKVDGVLSVCPYYNRPDQNGIYQHFKQISEATDLRIVLYNIPYRTGRNIENETIHKLAALGNIVGLKDSCGDIKQTTELLLHPPASFSILTGEDALFYTTLVLGGSGGILAASHLATESFVEVYRLVRANDHQAALKIWRGLAEFVPLLFKEPNPAPIKYCLKRRGLIQSLETRLPLTEISEELKRQLDRVLV
ncbi:MAG: 4-hydroxy-tetrahydrodipicolinate synthase [Bacteroidota bacterium]